MLKTFLGLFAAAWLAASSLGAAEVIRGGGATFPYPLYQQWIEQYQKATDTRITYEAVGSGGGIARLLDRKVDFGATDAFMSDDDLKQAPAPILHLPTCIGAVTIVYRLPDSPSLRFTPELLASVFLGQIGKWNDPRLVQINPGLRLPDLDIALVHRSDSSGTTYIFTDYLSKVSASWRKTVGPGKTVQWPAGMGVDGNGQVAQMLKEVDGSIGYVEFTYAAKERISIGQIMNRAGEFVRPDLDSIMAAGRLDFPNDMRVMLDDTSSPQGYPISGFSYLIFYQEQAYDGRTPEQAKALARFLWWATHEGQAYNRGIYYGALPKESIAKSEAIVRKMTFGGKALVDW